MISSKLLQALKDNPKLKDTGYISNPKLAKRYDIPIEDVIDTKESISSNKESKLTKTVNEDKGTLQSELTCDFEPKNTEELYNLHKVDPKVYKISSYWSTMKPNGIFTSSVLASKITEEDTFNEELLDELKKIFKEDYPRPAKAHKKRATSDKALFCYIADDHAGIDFKTSMFDAPYDGDVYANRLAILAEEILNVDEIDHLFIANLGDELNGFNSTTTRGGHDIESLSNKEQFNIYTAARKTFYDTIIQSGKFQDVTIININNSNHSGNDYSYMVNKALEFYIDAKYGHVNFIYQDKIIDSYSWGNHTIALCHGKDEKYMRSPMPLNLDAKTDLWLFDFYKRLKGEFFSCIKGDLHQYSLNVGKSGRYVNVPSICGGSNYIESNYGSSQAGALLEIVEKENKNIISIPIWF